MLLKQLNLINFRNYTKLDLTFDNRPTIFTGENGAGKSNILEAIYLLATTKSPRVETELEFINLSSENLSVKGEVTENNESTELLITMLKDLPAGRQEETGFIKKRVILNGVPRRVLDFIGNLPTVIFWPTDINMVTGSPSLRRWHLDISLAQAFPNYKKSLTLYEQILTSRNRVLKRIREGEAQADELIYWTDELVKEGEGLSKKRQEFFDFINNQTPSALGNFKFEYKQSLLSKERLETYREREIGSCLTLIGPHRDDFGFFLEKRNMSRFGSRGEQRMATLAFKLAILEYMAFVLGKRPMLLLDDVYSELDANHRAAVSEIAKLQQTIIATVELENIPRDFLDSARILRVEAGKIKDGK